MPIRKLVELDGEYGGWLEIDPVKLKRVATEFKQWLLKIDTNNDPFGFLEKDLPFVDAALEGKLKLPFLGAGPHNWEIREGLLDSDYLQASGDFYFTIRGLLGSPPEVIMKDGRYYAWCDFEDPEDTQPQHDKSS